MEPHDDDNPRPPSPRSLSKTPSWVTLGFVLGVAFMWFLPRPEIVPERPPPPAPAPRPPAPQVAVIEAVFEEWGQYAVWDHDKTEVALWEATSGTYANCFEVLRDGEHLYFRSIPRLTRPVLTHGVREDSPLLFTETEESRREWLNERTKENWRALGEGLRQRPSPPAQTGQP